jgi:glyoxylase I family protein
MPTFTGVDHVTLSVTDLDVSQRFYTDVLDFVFIVDFGEARVFGHRDTGLGLNLVRHAAADGAPFTELHTGLDHIGLLVSDRDELVAWEQRFTDVGVPFTPIRDMPFGHHLNFRDPDNIPLELYVPSPVIVQAYDELRARDVSREEIDARVAEILSGAVS